MMMDTQFSRCLHDHGDDVDAMINVHTKSSAVSIFCDRVCLTVCYSFHDASSNGHLNIKDGLYFVLCTLHNLTHIVHSIVVKF